MRLGPSTLSASSSASSELLPTPYRGWGLAAYLFAGLIVFGIAYFLVRIPFQVSDNVANMLAVRRLSLMELLTVNQGGGGYVRPFLWATINAVFEVANGHYFFAFKTFHVIEIAVLLWLVVRFTAVHSFADFVAVPMMLTVLVGFHTFRNLVVEAFPVNTYLTILVCLAAALNLSIARPRLLIDVLALLLFVFAVLTVESGVLIWVAFVAAYLAGSRGVSPRGLALTTLALGLYFAYRFTANVGVPAFAAPSGFGFVVLQRQEQMARFGDNQWPFWLYNVASSVLTVLFAEPRRGMFDFLRQWQLDDVRGWSLISVGVTTATTLLIGWFIAGSLRRWLHGHVGPRDRAVVVFLGVLAANATISFAYCKDEIMSPAGLMYAVAVHPVITHLVVRNPRLTGSAWRSSLAALPLCMMATLWSLRAIDLPYNIQLGGVRNRTDWARVDEWKRINEIDTKEPDSDLFIRRLEQEALAKHVPNPILRFRWWERYSDH